MFGSEAVSLRGKEDEGAGLTRMVSFRCPDELVQYVKAQAISSGRKETRVYVQALELDRDLEVGLKDHNKVLSLFAANAGYDLRVELGKAIADLARRGLDAWQAEQAGHSAPEPKKPKR